MNPFWSWALTLIGITGWWLVGNKRRVGFVVGFGVQFLWIAYAVTTEQWGFLVSAGLYGFVAARNWLRWGDADTGRPSVRCPWKRLSLDEQLEAEAVRTGVGWDVRFDRSTLGWEGRLDGMSGHWDAATEHGVKRSVLSGYRVCPDVAQGAT